MGAVCGGTCGGARPRVAEAERPAGAFPSAAVQGGVCVVRIGGRVLLIVCLVCVEVRSTPNDSRYR